MVPSKLLPASTQKEADDNCGEREVFLGSRQNTLKTVLQYSPICLSAMSQQDHLTNADGLAGTTLGGLCLATSILLVQGNGSASKVLAAQARGPGFNLQNPGRKLGIAVYACNPNIEEMATGGILGLVDQPVWPISNLQVQ